MFGFLTVIFIIIATGHALAYKFFVSVFSVHASRLVPLRLLFAILSVTFIGATIVSNSAENWLTRAFYTASATWLGFLLYILLAALAYAIISFVAGHVAPALPLHLIGKSLLGIALLVGIYGVINANSINVTKLSVTLPNLPEEWKGRTAVFFADMHLGQVHGSRFAQKAARVIREQNAALVFQAGDLFDGATGNAQEQAFPFNEVRPAFGHYYVTGNHELYGDTETFLDAARRSNMRVLANEAVELEGLQIIGADYALTSDKDEFEKFLKQLPLDPHKPSILIKHTPLHLDVAEQAGISLQVSGHTHRAQVFPFNLITKAVYKGYDYGLKPLGNMQVLVTDGVGTWGPPLRVGTNSEIMVITFQ